MIWVVVEKAPDGNLEKIMGNCPDLSEPEGVRSGTLHVGKGYIWPYSPESITVGGLMDKALENAKNPTGYWLPTSAYVGTPYNTEK